METNLVIEGLKFMVLGMGTVFVFLIIMIIAMNIMSKIIHKFFPEPAPSHTAPTQQSNTTSTNSANKAKVVAAISAAIMHHRQG